MIAVDVQNERIVEYLLNQGANPLVRNRFGELASDLASRHTKIFQTLKGFELLSATVEDDLYLVRALIQADPTIIDFRGVGGYTALLIAVEQSNEEIVAFLLENGADFNIINDNGDGVLTLACEESIKSFFYEQDEPEDDVVKHFEHKQEDCINDPHEPLSESKLFPKNHVFFTPQNMAATLLSSSSDTQAKKDLSFSQLE